MINPIVSALNFINTTFASLRGDYGDDIPTRNGILLLNKDNFNRAVKTYDPLVVHFYLPWCAHCQKFVPEFSKVALLLSNQRSQITVAEVDAEAEAALVKEQQIAAFPAVRLFKNGNPVAYYGLRKAENIVKWLNNKCSD